MRPSHRWGRRAPGGAVRTDATPLHNLLSVGVGIFFPRLTAPPVRRRVVLGMWQHLGTTSRRNQGNLGVLEAQGTSRGAGLPSCQARDVHRPVLTDRRIWLTYGQYALACVVGEAELLLGSCSAEADGHLLRCLRHAVQDNALHTCLELRDTLGRICAAHGASGMRAAADDPACFEGHLAPCEVAVLVGKGRAVIHVDLTFRQALGRGRDDNGVGVMHHLGGGTARSLLLEEDRAAELQHGDMVGRRDELHARAARARSEPSVRVVVQGHGVSGQAEEGLCHARLSDGLDDESVAQEEGRLLGEASLVLGELEEEGAHHWHAVEVGCGKERVDVGQQAVPLAYRLTNALCVGLTQDPRLAALGLDVSVRAEEGVVRTHLVPAHEELRLGIVEESAHVRAGEGNAANAEREEHRGGGSEVLPFGHVVARPHRSGPLRACKEGAREHKGALALGARGARRAAAQEALPGGHCLQVAVHVVHVAVLDRAPGMEAVLLHSHLRPVEDGGLVHVVPHVQVLGGARVRVELELVSPVGPRGGVEKVDVGRGPRPAPAVKGAVVVCAHKQVRRLGIGKDRVVVVVLDVGVDDDHGAVPALGEHVLQALGVWELLRVPREVALALRVLNVQPQHVVRDVVLLKLAVHVSHVRVVVVVPPALVVGCGEEGRHEGRACESRVLAHHLRGPGPEKDEEVQHARLCNPMRVCHRVASGIAWCACALARHVHIHLSCVGPEGAH
mmetsp:Transcript_22353/g.69850  ORF Transcript_22353/g.69850 Transcript_22353/m.69850 type:complete len:731 (-) Transcript_22353:901-3093(-)